MDGFSKGGLGESSSWFLQKEEECVTRAQPTESLQSLEGFLNVLLQIENTASTPLQEA